VAARGSRARIVDTKPRTIEPTTVTTDQTRLEVVVTHRPGGGGAGAWFFLKSGDKHAEAKAEEVPLTPPTVAFSDIEKLTVNIQGGGAAPAYLQLSVSLELENEEQKHAMEALLPRVKDQFEAYLRELRLEDLNGSAGVLRIKEELLRRVNASAAPYKVRDVLLKQMIIQ